MARSLFLLFLTASPLLGQEPRGPTVDERIRAEAARVPLALRFDGSTEKECLAWQKFFATKLRELLGPHAPPKSWKVEVERVVDEDGYRFEELLLTAEGHPPLPVCVLVP